MKFSALLGLPTVLVPSDQAHSRVAPLYNNLNLPQSMTKGANVVTMTYTADGEKLSKAVTGGGATKNYVGGIEYAGANLEAIYYAEGRCTPNGATAFHYEYTLKDHLGNARVNFRANGTTVTFLEEMHYYPFGMLMEGIGTAAVTQNKYKYNGKELNDDFGLNLSDYGARWYDAAVGRWWSVDPLGEGYKPHSIYAYVGNNPIALIDPDGKQWADPKKDEEIAKGLQRKISSRITSETKSLSKYTEKENKIRTEIAEKGSSDKLEKQLAKAVDNIVSTKEMISELESASAVLDEMGSKDVEQKFTFNEITGSTGETYVNDNVITMDIISDANAIHESTHGYQIYKKEIIGGAKGRNIFPSGGNTVVNTEIAAYRRQFAFDPSSVTNGVPSYSGIISNLGGINRIWLIGINEKVDFSGDFLYANTILGRSIDPKIVKSIIDEHKKNK
jgi:RHS repeat-associated protein